MAQYSKEDKLPVETQIREAEKALRKLAIENPGKKVEVEIGGYDGVRLKVDPSPFGNGDPTLPGIIIGALLAAALGGVAFFIGDKASKRKKQ